MVISLYSFLFIRNGHYYIYNTLSNALLEIDQCAYNKLYNALQNNKSLNIESFDPKLRDILEDKYFITDNNSDDFLLYKSMIMPLRAQKNFMHLTLAPTMECNFHCFYCFETEKPKGKILPETMDAIVKYVEAIPELEKIYLTWFGGEPLMAVDEMVQFYEKLQKRFHKKYASNIITTGYFLSESVINILQKLRVESVQITLDGNRERHNKVKYLSSGEDVFSRIMNNVDLLTEKAPEIEVVFRVNITRQNAAEYATLYEYLKHRFYNKNVSVSPGFVQNRTQNKKQDQFCLNREEITQFILELWNKHGIYTPWIQYPHDGCQECAIRDQRAISFDAAGYAYKCWEMIGKRQYAIGRLNNDGEITNVNRTLINRQLYGADPLENSQCINCAYLPICEGGCPIQRIQNEFEGSCNDVCTIYKDHLEEFLKIHIALKDAGYENH